MAVSSKSKPPSDYLVDTDLSPAQIKSVLELSLKMKKQPRLFQSALKGKIVALLFEKASLRTKFTLQIGISQMGGYSVINEGKLGDREPLKDLARNLERWSDIVVARVYSQTTLEQLAEHSSIPVVNALSNLYHPCQVLADMLTLKERFGKLKNLDLAFVGDGNNVANSLILTSANLGLNFKIATPKGFGPKPDILKRAKILNLKSGGSVLVTGDIKQAVNEADAIYTDTWISMGLEQETEARVKIFKAYQVTEKLFKSARKNAVFMHCLPRHQGQEVTDEVFESERSLVFEQAENRLHTTKALLAFLVSGNG